MRVALFITCYNDTLFPQTGIATVRLLERLGHTVEFPEDQTCCGQMHSNTGYGDEAIPLIRRFVKSFRDAEVIVSPSSSCVSNIRTAWLRTLADTGDEALKRDVAEIVPRVFELSQFLVERLGIDDVGAYYPRRVTYHPTCNSLRALKVGEAPMRLLAKVRGLDLVELVTEYLERVTRDRKLERPSRSL